MRALTAAALAATALVAPGTVAGAVGPVPSPYAGCGPVGVTGGEWRSFGKDLSNTRHQERERAIAHADVPTLGPAWTFSSVEAGGAGDFTGTPVIADGCLYVGSNRGWVFALNADTGALVWKAQVPEGGGINASVGVADGRVYAAVSRTSRGDGGCPDPCVGPYLVAFDQATGDVVWHTTPLDTQPGADVYASPIVYQGAVFLGISGGSAELGDETDRYAFQGAITFTDAATGTLLKKTWTIHPPMTPDDEFAGATVWSTPAIDPATGHAYVGAGNPFKPQAEHPHANAVLKVDVDPGRATFGEIVDSYKGDIDEYVDLSALPCVDFVGNYPPYYPQGLGSCSDLDLDFGASPNLFTDASGRTLIGAGQKSGVYHVFYADTMDRAWTSLVGPPSLVGGIVGSTAYDGSSIYGPVTPAGYLWSVDKAGGTPRWVSPVADGAHWGEPVAVANGIVYTVDLKGFLDAYDARNGVPLLHRPIVAGSRTGADPAASWGGVAVARNTVYAATGITGLENGFVVAFRPGANEQTVPPLPPVPSVEGSPGPAIVAGPGGFATTYVTPAMVTRVGGPLSFVNNDLPQHDVVAVDKAPDGSPLFKTPLIGIGEVAPVTGLDRVESGRTYGFYCSIHPGMKGTLAVL